VIGIVRPRAFTLLLIAVAIVVLPGVGAGEMAAQEYPIAAEGSGASAVQAQSTDASVVGATAGLPARDTPPRTLRAFTHVFVALALTWLLLFGYVISLGRRFARLDAEVLALGRGGGA
jgi:CcmD family protein